MMAASLLADLALTYPVRREFGRTIVGNPEPGFPIERCIPDILLAVFQAIVDDEAASYSTKSSWYNVNPRATVSLALVCRHWKQLVYDAPSLWAVIKLDARQYVNDSPPSFRIRLAKDAPVDLYLFHFPALLEDAPYISRLLEVVPNLRRLHVELDPGQNDATTPLITLLLLNQAWRELRNVKEISYSAPSINHFRADLVDHLYGMPKLIHLWLNESRFTVPYCADKPLLPALKRLFLQGSFIRNDNNAALITPTFLSHCPQLEDLDLTILDPHITIRIEAAAVEAPTITLPRLRKIRTSGMAVLAPFINRQIITPALEDFALFNWTDLYSTDMLAFFTDVAPTLTSLFLSVTDSAHYQRALTPLGQLNYLSILAGGQGTFLCPLYEPISTSLGTASMTTTTATTSTRLCLPCLRFFKLSVNRSVLAPEYFVPFVKARCIPIDEQRMTAAGCRALDNFCLVTIKPSEVLKYVRTTLEWQSATIRQAGPCVFELHWEFKQAE
ncbi:hypothetical protein M408DRAFT_212605 [Serendipita vermifera MAFF 305830]|uniref:Uncharacterized protein n=1 Tax=Serendipita vermifera MAFF 305830 TaxID=933852 RepID=A0A0C3AZD3_SERVB|nr:hypothetical protein M408DRAFT_212605 [Serendipita vermifera MAFF 305830]